MSCCPGGDEPICPCGPPAFPLAIANPPGLAAIAYRVGDYASFRRALLLPRAGETQLTRADGNTVTPIWRPGAQGDLAVQMIEWWAYLCDVLTFYNERIANESYLRTAGLPESVNRLILLLGYRPRPGIGATGTLAALATGSGTSPITLPPGFQVQSKPGPGQQPQVFELSTAVTITPPISPPGTDAAQGTASVQTPTTASPAPTGTSGRVVLAGSSSAVKAGDRVLILPSPTAAASATGFAVATVTLITPEKDPLGNAITTVTLGNMNSTIPAQGDITQYQLWRTSLSVQVWQYPADPSYVVASGSTASTLQVDLATIVRGLQPGDPIVFDGTDPSLPQYGSLVSSTEAVWYANPADYTPGPNASVAGVDPSVPPAPPSGSPAGTPPPVAIPIPHTRITFGWPQDVAPGSLTNLPGYLVRYGWKVAGDLIAIPSATVGGPDDGGGTGTATAASPSALTLGLPASQSFGVPSGTTVLVQDVNGNGASGTVDSATSMHIDPPVPMLVPPLQVLFNLMTVTRGKTVASEVLGSGNSLVAGQDFVLQNAPVTYLTDPNSISGDNYSSTVSVWVNQLRWSEVRSFYGQPPDAQVFMTREDEQGQTHVVFGDGQNGARLPTGVNNVTASYRYGSGAAAPAAGSLTVVLQPQPGLRSILNPVPVGAGADPDPPARVRQLAPQSVLTFGRAISVDDYQTIAAQAPGVTRARAAVAFDPMAQRPRVTVWVGDDDNAVTAAQLALAVSADPNRLPRVVLAQAMEMTLSLTIVYDPSHDGPTLQAAVHDALVDPDAGLLGVNVVGIGEVFYDSQVYAACLAVPGVVAVHSLDFAVTSTRMAPIYTRYRASELIRFVPIGLGQAPSTPTTPMVSAAPPTCCGQRHDPGADSYLFLPDVEPNLTIALETAS